MRRRFRYDKATDKMIEVPLYDDPLSEVMVHGDVQPFVSPLDGSVVQGRREYVEHMRKHNVQPYEPGSEKVRPAGRAPEERKATREMIWELADRVSRGHKARD